MGITNFRKFDTFPAYADVSDDIVADYQVVATNENDLLIVNSSSAITITIPAGVAIATKRSFTVVQKGTGQVFVTPASGVTIFVEPGGTINSTSTPNKVSTKRQYSKLIFTKIADNTWLTEGYENYVQATAPSNPVAGDLWFY